MQSHAGICGLPFRPGGLTVAKLCRPCKRRRESLTLGGRTVQRPACWNSSLGRCWQLIAKGLITNSTLHWSRLRRDLAEAVDLAMIQHHARRADDIPSGSRAIFQRPEHAAQHRLIGKHLIQRTAVEVLMLNRTGRVYHGDELIAVIDVVFHDRCLTGHRQRLVDAITGIVIRVRHSLRQLRRAVDWSVVELNLRQSTPFLNHLFFGWLRRFSPPFLQLGRHQCLLLCLKWMALYQPNFNPVENPVVASNDTDSHTK